MLADFHDTFSRCLPLEDKVFLDILRRLKTKTLKFTTKAVGVEKKVEN
jgi:hypothetical protein